MAKLFTV